MNKIISTALRACFVILILTGNSALAQDPSWGGVSDLSATLQDAFDPQIGLSSDGTKATAVWYRYDGSNRFIQSASATISGDIATWGSETDLSTTGEHAYGAQIGLSSDGTKATAVWYFYNGTNWFIQSKSATISGDIATWGSVTDLSDTGQDAYGPQIGLSSDGTKATAVWYRYDGTNYIIQSKSASISGNIATWGDVTDLSDTGQDALEPQITLSSDGTKAIAVWRRYNSSNNIIQSASATISENAATWSSVTDLSVTGGNALGSQVTLSSDGTKATAVWFRSNGLNHIIQSASASISENTATWSSVTDLSATGEDALEPQITLSSDGTKAIAVWRRSDGSNNIIQSASATLSENTATWGSVTDLSATGRSAFNPQIGLSSDGTKATAVWRRLDGSNYIIQSASAIISGNAATWDSVTDLSAAGQDANGSQIGLSSDGTKATAVWRRYDGSNDIIQSASIGLEDCSYYVIKSSAGKAAVICL